VHAGGLEEVARKAERRPSAFVEPGERVVVEANVERGEVLDGLCLRTGADDRDDRRRRGAPEEPPDRCLRRRAVMVGRRRADLRRRSLASAEAVGAAGADAARGRRLPVGTLRAAVERNARAGPREVAVLRIGSVRFSVLAAEPDGGYRICVRSSR
jgi:hypothetical protein